MRRPGRAGYIYPFESGATGPSRVDQGVDFGGSGAVRAIGRARILKTNSPWPEYSGGAGILYQLLEGPMKGRTVYVYEGVKSAVKAGQVVNPGQVIGQIVPGTSSGIETGWANPKTGQPINHHYWATEDPTEAPTKGGKSFASFLSHLPTAGAAGSAFEKSLIAQGKSPAEIKKIMGEDLGAGGLGLPGEKGFEEAPGKIKGTVEGIVSPIEKGKELTEALVGALENPETLMLNIALLGGGAFLVYYGAAKVLGVHRPLAAPAAVAAKGAAAA